MYSSDSTLFNKYFYWHLKFRSIAAVAGGSRGQKILPVENEGCIQWCFYIQKSPERIRHFTQNWLTPILFRQIFAALAPQMWLFFILLCANFNILLLDQIPDLEFNWCNIQNITFMLHLRYLTLPKLDKMFLQWIETSFIDEWIMDIIVSCSHNSKRGL